MKKLFALALLGALSFGLVAAACAEPVQLEYRFVKDDVARYVTTVDLNVQLPEMPGVPKGPLAFTISAQQAQKVVAVYPDGTARIKVWTGNIKMTSTVKEFALPKGKTPDSTSYMKMSKLGKILAVDMPQPADFKKPGKNGAQKMPAIPGFDTSKIIGMFGDLNAFPAEPIEVGSSWSKPIPLPENIGSIELVNTLTSIDEQFAGARAAKVSQTLSSNINLAQAAKAVMNVIAASMPGGSNASMKMPDFQGDLNVAWTGNIYFSVDQGKSLGQVGEGRFTINVKLPAEAVAQGAPAEINAAADIKVSQVKI